MSGVVMSHRATRAQAELLRDLGVLDSQVNLVRPLTIGEAGELIDKLVMAGRGDKLPIRNNGLRKTAPRRGLRR